MEAQIQCVQQTGSNQRRLAAPRRSENGQKSSGSQAIHHGVNTAVPAEEQVRFFACESPKSRVGQPAGWSHGVNSSRRVRISAIFQPSGQFMKCALGNVTPISGFCAGGPLQIASNFGSASRFGFTLPKNRN